MTSQRTIDRQPLLTALMEDKTRVTQVQVARINLEPGQHAGLHYHPVPVVGYIAQGAIRFQVEGRNDQILNTGDAFHEPANTRILHFDNASEQAPASFIAFYLLDQPNQSLIEMLY